MGFAERVIDFPEFLFALLGRHLLRVYPPYFHKLKVIVETFFHVATLISSISTGAAPECDPSTLLDLPVIPDGPGCLPAGCEGSRPWA